MSYQSHIRHFRCWRSCAALRRTTCRRMLALLSYVPSTRGSGTLRQDVLGSVDALIRLATEGITTSSTKVFSIFKIERCKLDCCRTSSKSVASTAVEIQLRRNPFRAIMPSYPWMRSWSHCYRTPSPSLPLPVGRLSAYPQHGPPAVQRSASASLPRTPRLLGGYATLTSQVYEGQNRKHFNQSYPAVAAPEPVTACPLLGVSYSLPAWGFWKTGGRLSVA